uniref:Uncharacterized protein n=1 Tax=Pseudomonas phage Touem01 TaxID=3138548 RepID=A0AAU6W2T9_9VIRU
MIAIYQHGERCRLAGAPKDKNPHVRMSQAWAWWMAGWNDQDIAIIQAEQIGA